MTPNPIWPPRPATQPVAISSPASARAIVVDFETCSRLDLKKVGAYRYAEDPSTRVIAQAWQFLQGDPDKHEWALARIFSSQTISRPPQLPVGDKTIFVAHNASFERAIWKAMHERHGWPEVPPLEQWRDTMAMAAYWGLPQSLDGACSALRISVSKDMEGHRLMLQLCKPRRIEADGTVRWWHEEEPEKHTRLLDYCKQDVAAEVALFQALKPLPEREEQIWRVDQRINDRGVGLDAVLVGQMRQVAAAESRRLDSEMARKTRNAVPSTRALAQLGDYLRGACGIAMPDLAKHTLETVIPRLRDALPKPGYEYQHAADLLELRLAASKSSVAKLETMARWRCADGLLHGMLQHYGAAGTGRWAGRGPQPQNFPRPVRGVDVELAIKLLHSNPKALELFVAGDPMAILSSCLRGCLTAHPGRVIVAADYSQVETRVAAWMAYELAVLQAFERKEDVYVLTAAEMASTDRQFGKVMTLSCIFQTGGPKLRVTAERGYGITLSEDEANEAVRKWREVRTNTVQLWWDLDAAARRAIEMPGQWQDGSPKCLGTHVHFLFHPGTKALYMRLPSGRYLTYRDAALEDNPRFPGGHRQSVTFYRVDQTTRKWEKSWGYGGLWCNNAVQGTARDLMADAMVAAEAHPTLEPILSVHDELLCQTEPAIADAALQELLDIMRRRPSWGEDIPLTAEGYVSDRFQKG